MQKSLKTLLEQSLGKDSQGSGQGNTREGSGRVKKMYGVVTSGTNRILSVGELLRTLVVVLKHAFTKEAHCTPCTQTHQSLALTSGMDKVPVKEYLFRGHAHIT